METKVTMVVLFITCLVLIKANEHFYEALYNLTDSEIKVVKMARSKVTRQIPKSNISTIKNWYFGVSDCWNTSLTDSQRLDDNYARLTILKEYAVKLNISKKRYALQDITIGITNLYNALSLMKRNLYPAANAKNVLTPVPGHFNAITAQKRLLVDLAFLITLEKNYRLMKQDFDQKFQTKFA